MRAHPPRVLLGDSEQSRGNGVTRREAGNLPMRLHGCVMSHLPEDNTGTVTHVLGSFHTAVQEALVGKTLRISLAAPSSTYFHLMGQGAPHVLQ